MAPYLINQVVLSGYLLICGPGKEPEMFLVMSIPDNNLSVSSTIVQSVNWHIPDQKGFWGDVWSKIPVYSRE